MKKWIVAPIVGGVILFLWQFFSWTFSGLHDAEAQYTPKQDSIMAALSANLDKDGTYMLPTCPPGSSWAEQEKLGNSLAGKPWAIVTYHTSMNPDMVLPMTRGLLINILIVFCLIYVLTRSGTPTFIRTIGASVAIGLICFLIGPYVQHNWFQTPANTLYGHLVDAFVGWGLVGAYVGWSLNRKKTA